MKANKIIVLLFTIVVFVFFGFFGRSGFFPFERTLLKWGPICKYSRRLDHFSVVVAQPGSQVVLETQWPEAKYPTFSHWVKEGEPFKNASFGSSFGVRNDTLFVFSSSKDIEHIGDSFQCFGIKSIVGGEKSEIHLDYFLADTLKVKLRYAQLNGDFDPTKNKSIILDIEADSSKIDISRSNPLYFDQIKVKLNRSHLKFTVPRKNSGNLSGTLTNYSRLFVTDGRPKVKIWWDETSYSNIE